MNNTEAWAFEERFWLNGELFYRANLAHDCLMVFPAPFGILDNAGIHASLADAPRWDSVSMSERVLARPDNTTIVLGYRAAGIRVGDSPYYAYCTSTYRKDDQSWKLVQHQQTPIV